MKDYARFSRTGQHLTEGHQEHKQNGRGRPSQSSSTSNQKRHHQKNHPRSYHHKQSHHKQSHHHPTNRFRPQRISRYQFELRRLGEPIILFGENNVAIRKRLQDAIEKHNDKPKSEAESAATAIAEERKALTASTPQNPHEARLHALRLKLNAIHQSNLDELVQSNRPKKKKFPTRTIQKHRRRAHMNSLDVTIGESQENDLKQAAKAANMPYTGWEVHSVNNAFRNYNKQLDNLPYTEEELRDASHQTNTLEADASTRYGATDVESKNATRRMALEERDRYKKRQEGKAANVARFVKHPEVNYINSKNMYFNRTLDKYYGQYTDDVKLKLERGTS